MDRGDDAELPDIVWLRPDSAARTGTDWDNAFGRCIGVYLNGDGSPDCDDRRWEVEIHTGVPMASHFGAGEVVSVAARSTVVLRAADRI